MQCSVALFFAIATIVGGGALISVSLIGPWVSLSYRFDPLLLKVNFADADSDPQRLEIIKVIGDPRETTDMCHTFQRGLYKYFGDGKGCSHLGRLNNHRTSTESTCAKLLVGALVPLGIGLLCAVAGLAGVKVIPPKYPLILCLTISAILVIAAVSLYPSKRSKYPPPLEHASEDNIFAQSEDLAYGYTTAAISVALLVCAAVVTLCSIGVDRDEDG